MRWKLLIITSLVAALLSVGGMYLLTYLLDDYLTPSRVSLGFGAGLLLIPLMVTTLAFVFVYRHTARRRKLQATLTSLASLVLTTIVLFIVQVLSTQLPR